MTRKHLIIMLLCCLVPVAILGAIFLLNVPGNSMPLMILILACPISHLLMMRFMDQDPSMVVGEDSHRFRERLDKIAIQLNVVRQEYRSLASKFRQS